MTNNTMKKSVSLNRTVSMIQLEPQPHRSRWTEAEDLFLITCFNRVTPLEEIAATISLRTHNAILTRANYLGYGNYRNKDDTDTYFKREINHKTRRTKEELLEETGKVPIEFIKPTDTLVKVDTDIVPKVEVALTDIDHIIAQLQALKSIA